jgi:hypothetical protein
MYGGIRFYKMGRTTGWTGGNILHTCYERFDYPFLGQALICQFEADMYVDPGDSGGGVFRYEPGQYGYGPGVQLAGVLWGKTSLGLEFSPIHNVQQDFGYLYTYAGKPAGDIACPIFYFSYEYWPNCNGYQ